MLRDVLVRLPIAIPVVLAAVLFGGSPAVGGDPADPLNLQCDGDSGVRATTPDPTDGRTRDAAQKGLDFLASDTVRWQQSNQCYGCHVQAVTLQAMSVGRHNQYTVEEKALDVVLAGITD